MGARSIALLSVSQTVGPQLSPGTLVVDLGTLLLVARPQGGPLQLTLMAVSDQSSGGLAGPRRMPGINRDP